jgi:ABC-type transport system involved in multi-copper enzyme maturation permease subunit
MNRNKIVLGLGIIVFIVGFIFVSLVSFFANTRNLNVDGESQFIRTMGSWSLLGLALISIGVVVILLTKLER